MGPAKSVECSGRSCYDSAWNGMLALVLVVILRFSLGMPIFFARLLWVPLICYMYRE